VLPLIRRERCRPRRYHLERRRAHGGDGKLQFDANFASPAYLIETVVCYPSCCAGGNRNLSRHAASIMCSRAPHGGVAIRPMAIRC
jgi:hypothetical protein